MEKQQRGNKRLGLVLVTLITVLFVACSGIRMEDLEAPHPLPPGSCVVIGFLGGRDRWNDETKGIRQTALRLRDSSEKIYAETFENRSRDVAEQFIISAMDSNGNRAIEAAEADGVKLVVYGQSLGGSATLKFAHSLAAMELPVELTMQVDSVGFGDAVVPANVRYAANLYQDDGLLIEGEHPIRAVDPSRTQILGNWKFDYDQSPGADISIDDLPWWKIIFRIAHAKMDRDPRVWTAVEELLGAACSGENLENLSADLFNRLAH